MTIYKNHITIYLIGLLCCVVFLLTGCSPEQKNIDIKADTGETIQATLALQDNFDMKESSGVLMVYQKKKLMMQIAFLDDKQRQAQVDHMREGNMSRVLKEEGKRISYERTDAQGLVNYFIFPVGEKTYAYGATYLPEEAAESVLQRMKWQAVKK